MMHLALLHGGPLGLCIADIALLVQLSSATLPYIAHFIAGLVLLLRKVLA